MPEERPIDQLADRLTRRRQFQWDWDYNYGHVIDYYERKDGRRRSFFLCGRSDLAFINALYEGTVSLQPVENLCPRCVEKILKGNDYESFFAAVTEKA